MSQTSKSTETKPPSAESEKDFKSCSNYESLFDSGYNSNMQSSTFLELDSQTSITSDLASGEHLSHHSSSARHHQPSSSNTNINSKSSSKQLPQWSDSGLSITDSGLGIVEDDSHQECDDKSANKCADVGSQLKEEALKSWLANNNVADALLHLAIMEDLPEVACSIIENIPEQEDLNSYNYLYQTPLHLAVLKRQIDVIRLLIERGANIAFQDSLGNTPLHIACKYSLIDIVHYFLVCSHRTSLCARKCFEMHNFDGETCLHLAVQTNNLKLIELLLFYGTNINAQEAKSGKTILHCAVENLNVQMVQLLLTKYNPNINVRTFSNKTAIHFALKVHHSPALAKDNVAKTKIGKIVEMLTDSYNDLKVSLDELSSNSSSDSQSEYASSSSDED